MYLLLIGLEHCNSDCVVDNMSTVSLRFVNIELGQSVASLSFLSAKL